ncbi:MAG: chitobiase/beta-hexosaminidase C-terminal domain-containing protein, partial [Rectinemataceae bacterium]
KSTWQLHHPRLLDDAKMEAIRRGIWREESQGAVRTGPFPKETTNVHVRVKSRNEENGKAVLEIQPIGGTKVVYEFGSGTPGAASESVPDYNAFETDELIVKFLCIDESPNPAPNGEPYIWKNRIGLRNRIFQQGTDRVCELVAVPPADIFYTTDGSDPRARGVPYAGAFPIPKGVRIIQAYAKKHDIESELIKRDIEEGSSRTEIDPAKPLVWKTHHRFQNCATIDSYQLLSRLVEFKARAEKIELYYYYRDGGEELHYIASEPTTKKGEELMAILEHLSALSPQGNVSLSIQRILFERGQDFLDWKNADKIDVPESEIQK